MVPTFEDLTVDIKREFNGQWGSGRKFVSNDVYAASKKSIEGLSMMPSHRLDEPDFDSYRVCLGREFSYTCQSVLTSKRRRDDVSETRRGITTSLVLTMKVKFEKRLFKVSDVVIS